MALRYHNITKDDMLNGEGLRVVLWVSGCSHHCKGCHNPETHSFDGGYISHPENIIKAIEQNPLLQGVTFSGGEPFVQAEAFAELGEEIKKRGLHLMTYSGYTFEQLLNGSEAQKTLLKHIDVLIDGPFLQAEKTLTAVFRGSKNQRIINVPASLKEGKVIEITSGRWAGEY